MSGLYSDDILDGIARANDIIEVVSGYFPLKKAGKDYMALCPFHAEKTPSFTVSPAKQIFKCFGCGRGGSVFNFVMAKESITFPEAVRLLAERAGIELVDRSGAEKQVGARRRVREVLDWATGYFSAALKHPRAGGPGRAYLEARGIRPETVERFRIGYAPDAWDGLLRAAERESIPPDMLDQAGLVVRRDDGAGYYDRFRGRVIFPILDALGRPIAFGGRILGDGQPKYLNSPETVIFHKGEALYGLPQAREAIEADRRVVVVEGYFDVVMPYQEGVRNVVATLGTALTDEHIRALKRYADEVVLVFDSDLAGQRAADRSLELFLAHDVRILMTVVPQGKDPCDFCREAGGEAFRSQVAAAEDAFKYKWRLIQASLESATSPAAQRRALETMLSGILKAPALAQQDLRLQRDLILGHMSKTLGIPESTLRSEFARLRRTPGRSAAGLRPGEAGLRPGEAGTETGANLPQGATRGRRWAAERELLAALVCRPSRMAEVAAALPADRIETPEFRRLYEELLANRAARDGDIESIVLRLEDADLSGIAVELADRGEKVEACRQDGDTGPGPLARMLEQSLASLKQLDDEADLADRSRAAREPTEDSRAKEAYTEARLQRQGFVPPAARSPTRPDERRGAPGASEG